MKVLVTGGAGFIASHVADALIGAGHEVVIVDDLSGGFMENVNPKAKFVKLDITDPAMSDVFAAERPEMVNHHAAQMDVRKSVTDPLFDAGVNILGSIRLLEYARAAGVRKFIYASTAGAMYGFPEKIPVPSDAPVCPLSPYGISKHTVEHYLATYRALFGIDFTVLRYPNVYGPRQNPHGEAGVVAIFHKTMLAGNRPRIFGKGDKTRDYCFIRDIVRANMLAIDRAGGEIINLGTTVETTDFGVFDVVRKSIGWQGEPEFAPERPGEIQRIALEYGKAEKLLGWRPEYDFERGVAEATAFYRKKYGSGR